MKQFFLVMIVALGFMTQSCQHEPPVNPNGGKDTTGQNPPPAGNNCNPDSVYFENEILPLLTSSCGTIGCHDAGTKSEGLDVTTYNGIINSGKVKAGNPGGSDLVEVLNENDPDKVMPPPPANKLTPDQIAKITKWVQQGARNNACKSGCDTTKFAFAAQVKPLIDLKCKGCHSGAFPSGGIPLATHSEIKTQADNGKLLGTITHSNGFKAMPQGTAKMPDCEITIIRKWVLAGAPNN